MHFGPGACCFAILFVALAAPGELHAQADPCGPEATVSPCFDADALWLPTGATHFSTLPSARPPAEAASTLLLAVGLALEPVLLAVPSPDPEGRTVHVVNTTTTVTLGVGFGLGGGFGLHAELPFVPYQNGTGVEGVTAQQAPPLGSAAVRDPRFGVGWTAFGRNAIAPVALAAHFELAPPLGDETLLAGARGATFAPGVTFEGEIDRFVFATDMSLRLRSAVDFGTVTKGSEAVLGVGASVGVLSSPRLRLAVEAWIRPGLAGAPPNAGAALDLPAEWLLSSVFAWDSAGPFSLAAAGGSSLPVSRGPSPSGGTESFGAVTAPSFRALLALRFTPNESE